MAQARDAGRRTQAIIVGDGDQRAFLRAKSSEVGLDEVVRFTGRLPPPGARAYLRAADVAVLPRKRVEVGDIVSPLKPFEIMALGIPLVMSNVAPLADIAEDSGHAALLFEASDAKSLAAQIARLMDDPDLRRHMALRGREFIVTKRSWDHIARTMASALDELDGEMNTLTRTVARRVSVPLHFLRRLFRGPRLAAELALIGTSELFDACWYLQRYPDVARGTMSPFEHYLRFGVQEERDPGPGFDTRWYLESNPDVARSGINPLVHYLRHGRGEGRTPKQ
jgi:glycosyl transferase family 1